MPSLANPWVLLGLVVSLALSFGAGVGLGHHYGWLQEQAAVVGAQTAVIETQQDQQTITAATSQGAAEAKVQIQTVTETIIKEVPVYVTVEADRRCIVPRGAVRLHDFAAAGMRPVPDPAGQPDDGPSGVEISTVTETVADNYGTCHEITKDFAELQAWIRQQAALAKEKRP